MNFAEMEFANKFKGKAETNLSTKRTKFSARSQSILVSLVSHLKFSKLSKQ